MRTGEPDPPELAVPPRVRLLDVPPQTLPSHGQHSFSAFLLQNKIRQSSWVSINMFVSRPKAKLSVGQKLAIAALWFSVQKSGRKGGKRNKEQMEQGDKN